ncbi:heat-inducible transcription repressor HrcA [Dissulfurispira thermophila]|uniref:Heat-inducible transcription repressor HrcA n=2 Tax=root TaxID=1 RepID=A0A7G1H5I8_9BACT|nr:heat-inducible transcriptional repressor HrcA [Dissulfurispira thermophila]BCB97186.1 heat-inducible transcription repressor HrcA [Dissulfurispira thermophila]
MEFLDERSKQILYAVVQSYISKPEPVGSRFVTKKYSFGFSPATVRNIMADLEELGFLSQPHTSAGRVPTDKGYRFYVDSIMGVRDADRFISPSNDFMQQFARKIESIRSDLDNMFLEITNTLSMMSNYIGVVTPPRAEKTIFTRIEFIRYREDKVVAVLLTEEGVIKNKVIKVDLRLTQDDLNRIADYLNREYSGRTIDEIKGLLVKRAYKEKALWDRLISKAIKIYEQAISFKENDVFVSGLYDVMNLPDFSDISKIKEISKAIKDKHIILKLLDELSDSEGVHVFIGSENPVEEMKKLSVVASTYKEKDRPMGVIALIGPTRMDYPKAIYMVDAIARCISRTFD